MRSRVCAPAAPPVVRPIRDQLPRRRSPDPAGMRAPVWALVRAGMADAMEHHLQQITGAMRPGPVNRLVGRISRKGRR
ncbi:hypothetical protein ABIE67_000619 [Streptomyces sp. V4I8]|uniref:hypothetical protein n=1 Tax=Streptomyces sp. V4I8 TaxID=3156469 RepID=UPI0035138723